MRRAAQLLAVMCVVVLVATAAVAGGKKPPGGEDPSTGGGTIYFTVTEWISASEYASWVWTMNSDGSNKTALPVRAFLGDINQGEVIQRAQPSHQLHNGQRWFLQVWQLDPSQGTYPDGRPLRELVAISEDGATSVQLTADDPSDGSLLEPVQGWVRWTFDDAKVSWPARLWQEGEVVSGGLYSLAIAFDESGTPAPAPEGPGLLVEANLYSLPGYPDDPPLPDIWGHDWSPDSTAIVYGRRVDGVRTLTIVDAADPSTPSDLTEGWDPQWSPDGGAITFKGIQDGGSGLDALWTIGPDGSDCKIIFADTEKPKNGIQAEWHHNPCWSPTASHIACARQTYDTTVSVSCSDVVRATADGSQQTNLTRDLDTRRLDLYAVLIAWR